MSSGNNSRSQSASIAVARDKNRVHLAVAALHFADFRRHEQRAVLHLAFARQHPAPAVHQFAAQRALVHPPRHPIAEPD
jgi:hypothetical protein